MRNPIGTLLIALAACASGPPLSAAEHERAAVREEAAAQHERAQFDPKASEWVEQCANATPGTLPPCWTANVNPTAVHLEEAARHERIAQRHAAASQALRNREEQACVGVSESDRHLSPFAHRADITVFTIDTNPNGIPEGVTYTFSAVPGLTAQGMRNLITCHLAIDAELGNSVPEREDCPLVPHGVTAEVTSSGPNIVVRLRADSPATADAMIRRAQRLMQSGSTVPVSVR